MTISLQQARKICNSIELALVVDSTPKQIKNFDAKQLKSKVTRARSLRDKWRGQAEKLVRVTKKESQAKLDSDNARTELKSQLFSETLDRLSKRLETLEAKEIRPVNAAAQTKTPTIKAQHRAQRADVRTVLADAKDQMNVAASLKQVPVTQSTQSASKTDEPQAVTTTKVTSKKVARSTSKPTEATKAISKPVSIAATTPKLPTKKKKSSSSVATKSSVRIQAAAKSSAMVRGGAKPIHAHTSATGKRNQARRDSKK